MNRNAENNIENRYKMIDAMSEVYYSDFARMADCVSVILLPTVFLSVFQCFSAFSFVLKIADDFFFSCRQNCTKPQLVKTRLVLLQQELHSHLKCR